MSNNINLEKEEKLIGEYLRHNRGEMWLEPSYLEMEARYYRNNDVEIGDAYFDENCTNDYDRPQYNRLIKDIFEGKINTIMVFGGLDRLTKDESVLDKIKKNVQEIIVLDKGKETIITC